MILVTGATGLLGSHVVCELLSKGYEVRAMYRTEKRQQRVNELVRYYYPEQAVELLQKLSWLKGEILDLTDLEDAMKDCSEVIHCAALVSFHRRDFHALFEHNRTGTANVVNTALGLGIRKLVHISSTAAIGSDSETSDPVKRESNHWNPNESVSGYSLSKYSAEKEVWRGIEEGLNAVIVNPSLMFGPGSWDESSLKIMRTLKKGLKFYTRGANAFVDVRDVAVAVRLLLESDVTAERFLVAGHNLTFKAFFEAVCKQLNCNPPSVLASSLMTSLAWRLSGISARLAGKRPAITKESASSSHKSSVYSSEKILAQFPEFQFHSLEAMIDNTIKGELKI